MKFFTTLTKGLLLCLCIACPVSGKRVHISHQMDKLILGLIDPAKDSHFVRISRQDHLLKPNKIGIYLQKDVAKALRKVARRFSRHFPHTPFALLSGTRTFTSQKNIWEKKWEQLKQEGESNEKARNDILRYSSMPGTSRHHWGSDVDIIFIHSEDFQTAEGNKILRWLQQTMPRYGFRECYSPGRKGGYETEAWHWSYIPISKRYIRAYKKILATHPQKVLEVLRKVEGLEKDDISRQDLLKIIHQYVFDVNPSCL